VPRLKKVYGGVRIGNPLDGQILVGPLIDGAAFARVQDTPTYRRRALSSNKRLHRSPIVIGIFFSHRPSSCATSLNSSRFAPVPGLRVPVQLSEWLAMFSRMWSTREVAGMGR
jgi:hypothetical protein